MCSICYGTFVTYNYHSDGIRGKNGHVGSMDSTTTPIDINTPENHGLINRKASSEVTSQLPNKFILKKELPQHFRLWGG